MTEKYRHLYSNLSNFERSFSIISDFISHTWYHSVSRAFSKRASRRTKFDPCAASRAYSSAYRTRIASKYKKSTILVYYLNDDTNKQNIGMFIIFILLEWASSMNNSSSQMWPLNSTRYFLKAPFCFCYIYITKKSGRNRELISFFVCFRNTTVNNNNNNSVRRQPTATRRPLHHPQTQMRWAVRMQLLQQWIRIRLPMQALKNKSWWFRSSRPSRGLISNGPNSKLSK